MQGLCTITARCHEQIVHIQHGSNKNSAKKQCGQNTQSPYIQLSTGRRLDESLCHNMPDIGWHRCTNGGVESKSQAIEYTDSPHKHVVPHQVWPSLPYPATAFGREKRHCQWPGYRSLCAGSKLFTMAQSRQQRGIVQTRGKTPVTDSCSLRLGQHLAQRLLNLSPAVRCLRLAGQQCLQPFAGRYDAVAQRHHGGRIFA